VRSSWRRGGGDEDNPAWPGLSYIFAFGMVSMILIGALANQSYKKSVHEAFGQGEILRTKTRESLDGVQDQLGKLDIHSGVIDDPWPHIVVETFKGKPVYFDSLKYDLGVVDRENVRNFAVEIAPLLAAQPMVELVINGTADPQPLVSPQPPRDNVELSALRAATVAAVLRGAGISAERIFVQGLGEVGKSSMRDAPPRENTEAWSNFVEGLKQYRKVYLELRVDLSKVKIPLPR